MKKIILVFLFIFCLISCGQHQEKELTFQNQKYDYTNTEDLSQLAEVVSNIIPKTEGNYTLKEAQISSGIDEMTNEKYTYILFHDDVQKVKLALKLIEDMKNKKSFTVEPRLVICGGLETCIPVFIDNNWACDAELDSFKCKKSVILFN